MAKFTTPYDTLLRVRRIEEDKAKAVLASANATHREAVAHLEATREAHAAAMERSYGETSLEGFMRDALHGQRLAESVVLAGREVEKTDQARQAAIEHVTAASRKTQGLEKLVDRAREERMQQILAADQQVAEESSAGRRARASKARVKTGTNATRKTRKGDR